MRQRRLGVLEEQPGLLVVRVGLEQLGVAVDGLVVLVVVLVEDAEVDQHADVDRRMLQAALVVADGLVVVAGQVVGVAELEQGPGVAGSSSTAFSSAESSRILSPSARASVADWK